MSKQIGIIGLGKIGGNLAVQAIEKGFEIIGYDLFPPVALADSGITMTATLGQFVAKLERPRKIFVYIPAGVAVDELAERMSPLLAPGDILVDGGNSYWGDSIRRAARWKERGIHWVDCGTSGGMNGARNGACFMVGGDKDAIVLLEDFFRAMAVPDGFVHTGGPGSGHFVKLVHNGIEFGMLQAIGEGVDLLSKYREQLDIPAILHTWNHGSVIRSWLIELLKQQLDVQNGLNVPSYVEDTGEVNWLLTDAMHMEASIPVIAQSIMQLIASRDATHTSAKAIAMMRHGFGGHPFGPDKGIEYERNFGKVGGFER